MDPCITIDGLPVNFGNEIVIVDSIEASTCCYESLLVSERAIAGGPHAFLTTGHKTHYRAITCRVQLQIASWADLPECFAVYDDVLGPRIASGPPRYKRSAAEEYAESIVGPLSAIARSVFREKARTLGPHIGSFIPCSLWYGSALHEPECVLEITGAPEQAGRECVLHVLSHAQGGSVHAGFRLCTRSEVAAPVSKGYKEVLADLGEIVG